MKKAKIILAGIFLCGLTALSYGIYLEHSGAYATCTGSSSCSACKNCKYCKHCSKDKGTCGVCK